MIGQITHDHPHFQTMKNYQKLHSAGKKPNLAWVGSFCRYNDDMKCTLQIVLAERLILFGKDPSFILNSDLDRGEEFYMMSNEERKQTMYKYIDMLLDIYNRILY